MEELISLENAWVHSVSVKRVEKVVRMEEATMLGENISIGKNVKFGKNVIVYDNVEIGDNVTIEHSTIIGYNNLTNLREEARKLKRPFMTRIGENVLVRPYSIVYAGCRVGNHSRICSHVIMREFTELGEDSYLGNGTKVEGYTRIGNQTGIETQVHITAKSLIEDKVFIATMTVLANGYTISWCRPHIPTVEEGPKIRRGARIAIGVKILPGVEIGREAFVGAGAVVTRDVPPFKIAIGVPARIVGDVPDEERLRE
ncbi:MAG: DapH/DapD/GlmU-related protein [Thermoplasmata archaeon]